MSQDQSGREASRTSERSTYLSKNGYGLDFPRGRTALLVVDPVNDFLSEGGAA